MPTTGAIQAGYAKPCITDKGVMFFVWDRDRTIEALRKAGRRAKGSPPPELTGPFELRTMADDSFEIVGGDGLVATVIGERNANRMMKVLDVLWQNDIKKSAEMQEAAVTVAT